MAFITNIELPSGMVTVNSYCSIQVNSSKPPIATLYKQFAREDVESINPLDYGYKLLQASGEFPDATWNV